MQANTRDELPRGERTAKWGPAPLAADARRGVVTLWAYPKAGEMNLLAAAGDALVAEGAHAEAGMSLKDGRLVPSDLAILLVRFCRQNLSLGVEVPELEAGEIGKKMKLNFNAQEAEEWEMAASMVKPLIPKGVRFSPRLLLVTLASFYLNHSDSKQVPLDI